MIRVVDYGVCNIGSILNMYRRLGVEAQAAATPADVEGAERIILPGIGAFDAGMRNLAERGFAAPLAHAALERRVPVLGICLGMQLLGTGSSEGELPGLSWLEARVRHFNEMAPAAVKGLKLPHIGWNFIEQARPHPLLEGVEEPPRFYFVHSYCMDSAPPDTLARSRYGGIAFTAMVARANIAGAQFHPEKSHRFGMRLLRNFAGWQP